MNRSLKPHTRIYDGALYGFLLDPLLRGLHQRIAAYVPTESRVLDACCGPGGLSLILARRCQEVVGIDLSPRQIRYADRRRQKRHLDNLRFEVGDVAQLSHASGSFDIACVVMALHEMPAATRIPVLQELLRVAVEVIVVDFRIPMPRNRAGWRNRAFEFVAGGDHFRNFRDFSQRGGLGQLVKEAGVSVEFSRTMDSGTLTLQRLPGQQGVGGA